MKKTKASILRKRAEKRSKQQEKNGRYSIAEKMEEDKIVSFVPEKLQVSQQTKIKEIIQAMKRWDINDSSAGLRAFAEKMEDDKIVSFVPEKLQEKLQVSPNKFQIIEKPLHLPEWVSQNAKIKEIKRTMIRETLRDTLIGIAFIVAISFIIVSSVSLSELLESHRINMLESKSAFANEWISKIGSEHLSLDHESSGNYRLGKVFWLQCDDVDVNTYKDTGKTIISGEQLIFPLYVDDFFLSLLRIFRFDDSDQIYSENKLQRIGFSPTNIMKVEKTIGGEVYEKQIWRRWHVEQTPYWEKSSILAHSSEEANSVVLVRFVNEESLLGSMSYQSKLGERFIFVEKQLCEVKVINLDTGSCTAKNIFELTYVDGYKHNRYKERIEAFRDIKKEIEQWVINLQ
jgi:hypothetical protein